MFKQCPRVQKTLYFWLLYINERIELSQKQSWACWKHDSKDENLQFIHPIQTSNVEKIIMEILAKTP